MPLYEYQCNKCKHEFELMVSLSNTKPVVCAKCGSKKTTKVFSTCIFKFNGTGFYATDYERKGREKKRKMGK